MGFMVTDLILYILIPAVVAAGIIYGIVRRKRAMASKIADDTCVSCDSTDVTMLGQGAYRCNECGYEGGSGLAELRARANQDAIEAMDPTLRRSDAIRQLQDARSLLQNATDVMRPALELSAGAAVGLVHGKERQNDLAMCVEWFGRAQTEIQAAMQLLGQEEAGLGFEVDLNSPIFTLDPHVDNVIANVAAQRKIKQACEQAQSMLQGVDRVLERVEAPLG